MAISMKQKGRRHRWMNCNALDSGGGLPKMKKTKNGTVCGGCSKSDNAEEKKGLEVVK